MLYEKLEHEYAEAKSTGDSTKTLCLGLLRAHVRRLQTIAHRDISDAEIASEAAGIINSIKSAMDDEPHKYYGIAMELLAPYADHVKVLPETVVAVVEPEIVMLELNEIPDETVMEDVVDGLAIDELMSNEEPTPTKKRRRKKTDAEQS